MQVGWVAGAGVEYALADNWSIKGEALAYDLGSRQVSGPFLNDSTVPPRIYGWNVDNMGTTIRISLNKGL